MHEVEPISDNDAGQGARQLRRVLNLREAVALGVGGTIGGGIFVLIGVAAGRAGPAALLSFVLAFCASLLIALPYAELACRYPLAGGGYAFARTLLGPHWGFLMGWGYWGAYIFVSGYVTLGFGGYLHALVGLPTSVGALTLITTCTVLNLTGVRLSGLAQSLVIGTATIALLCFSLPGLPHVQLAHFTPFFPDGPGGMILAALLAFLAFGGFDMVAAAGEEIISPERNLPRAILLTLLLVLGLYLLVTFVALGVLPWNQLGASSAPLAAAATEFLGSAGRQFMAAIALLTTAATGNAVLIVTSRVSFAMARDGLLPAPLARVQLKTGAPWVAILLNGLLLAFVALTGSIELAAAIGGFLYVLHFLFTLVALVVLRRRGGPPPAFRTPLPWLVLPLAFASCILLLATSGLVGVSVGLAWLCAGLFTYAIVLKIRMRGLH
ncbi:MAG TPA: amino acid permease [Ktedonobacteraceae bacterium]|nr:amino acid permease [Ktedonobacteraceae bacterium]